MERTGIERLVQDANRAALYRFFLAGGAAPDQYALIRALRLHFAHHVPSIDVPAESDVDDC